jgi:hypothetical protein
VSIALGITACMRIEVMLTAIDLDDKAMLEADEVDDEVVARRLPAKMEAAFFRTGDAPTALLPEVSSACEGCVRFRLPWPPPGRLRFAPAATLPLRGRD